MRYRFGRAFERLMIRWGILATEEESKIYDAIDQELRRRGL